MINNYDYDSDYDCDTNLQECLDMIDNFVPEEPKLRQLPQLKQLKELRPVDGFDAKEVK